MKKAILATKVGMTQIFNEDGVLTPVTVLQAGPCVVTQVPTPFQRSETTIYLHHDLTLHTNLQFALVSRWETLLAGGCLFAYLLAKAY